VTRGDGDWEGDDRDLGDVIILVQSDGRTSGSKHRRIEREEVNGVLNKRNQDISPGSDNIY